MNPNQAIFIDGFLNAVNNFILFTLMVLFRQTVHHEGIRSFMLHLDRKGMALFVEGVAIGCMSFLLYPLTLTASGQGVLTVARDALPRTIGLLFTTGIGFLGVSLFEEGLFRGYLVDKLLPRTSKPIAIGLAAFAFGLFHLFSYPADNLLWLALLNSALFGLLFSMTVIASRSLMWAVGFHLAWNLTEYVSLIKQHNSVNTLFNLQPNEGILAGTSLTPESGILVTAILAVIGIYILIRFYGLRREPQPTLNDPIRSASLDKLPH